MTDEFETPGMQPSDVTSDDKLWAALGYPISIIAIIVLFMEEKKSRPFIKYHAVQSIVLNIAISAVAILLAVVTLGIGGICAPLLWFVTLWPAYESYNGGYTEIPVISNFIRNQGWV